MFIREIEKKNKGYSKTFKYHHLVESTRTKEGPRQQLILNLGTVDLPRKDWPLLANRIEEIVKGQQNFYVASPKIEQLAQFYARKIIDKRSGAVGDIKDYQRVDINNTEISDCRTIGSEYAAYSYLKNLELDKYLEDHYFSQRQIDIAFLLLIGRMVSPGSELHTYHWAKRNTALGELLGTDFSKLSQNTLYEVSDKLYKHKKGIENYLSSKERSLFNLKETIILYDLTNTYFEGRSEGLSKADYGNSKEKRYDCKLLTLGLIIDEDGYPKASKVMPGNQDDPGSLLEMIDELRKLGSARNDIPGDDGIITVVMDAGIATEDNLKMLRAEDNDDHDRIHYIAVSRRKPDEYFAEEAKLLTVRKDKKNTIEVQLLKPEGEDDTFLYCKSSAKGKKEESMRNKFEKLFEQGLENIKSSLYKKGGTKNFKKVCERVGRLRQKYPIVSAHYKVDVIQDKGKRRSYAAKVNWEYIKKEVADKKFSGRYYLRTDRDDLTEKEIFDIYIMLKRLEDAFRHMKTDLILRPNWHQKDIRAEGHIFITVLAYHVLNSILNRLQRCDYSGSWRTIKQILNTHVRGTMEFPSEDGEITYVRKCSRPNYEQKRIYDLLQLGEIPIKPRKYKAS
ncbi:IS1634 family transposase [bacterium]|nr:IS1634 family transposase [bacterium]